MTVMKMKDIIEFMKNSKEASIPTTNEGLERIVEEIDAVVESLAESGDLATDIILKKMPEEQLARFLEAVAKVTVFSGIALEEGGMGMVMALMSGDLKGYTDTVVLATIGALINEGIL